jgi:hypothetical protein
VEISVQHAKRLGTNLLTEDELYAIPHDNSVYVDVDLVGLVGYVLFFYLCC